MSFVMGGRRTRYFAMAHMHRSNFKQRNSTMKGHCMNSQEKSVTTVDELAATTKDNGVHHIVVRGSLTNAPSIRLAPDQSLRGGREHSSITFAVGADGLQLSSNNRLHDLRFTTTPDKRAIFNDTSRRKSRTDRIAQRNDDRPCSDSGARQGARRSCRRERPRHHRGGYPRGERAAARIRRVCASRRFHALEHAVRR